MCSTNECLVLRQLLMSHDTQLTVHTVLQCYRGHTDRQRAVCLHVVLPCWKASLLGQPSAYVDTYAGLVYCKLLRNAAVAVNHRQCRIH